MTFSIAAIDRATGDVGAAATTRFLAVGAGVLWAEVGVGAVCTQALARIEYGPELLDRLRAGSDPDTALAAVTAADAGREDRQLGVIDVTGRGATFTGRQCFAWAGGRVLTDATVQGNILVGPEVLDAMATVWADTGQQPLDRRLLSMLRAGDAVGGDRRGRQSAAILVRRAAGGDPIDLRVDDHPTPLAELDRLRTVYARTYETTPEAEWVAIDASLAPRIRSALVQAGYAVALGGLWDAELEAALHAWCFDASLDGRWSGGDRVDPVVLTYLLD